MGATFEELHDLLEVAWCAYTSSDPNWTPNNKALGQCAVTALVVQDYFGGELRRCQIGKASHYWNWIFVEDVDMTQEQFKFPVLEYKKKFIVRERDYVLSFPDTAKRYEFLRDYVRFLWDWNQLSIRKPKEDA